MEIFVTTVESAEPRLTIVSKQRISKSQGRELWRVCLGQDAVARAPLQLAERLSREFVRITASLEIAGRARGGKGLLGWIRALPWGEPMVLGVGLSLLQLAPGGFGGLVNMSYQMNAMIHNTAWIPAHFHLIFAGAVVIMYFAIANELWPRLTGRPLITKRLACVQLWLWFWGMLIMTVPWHITGLMGQPRRYAILDYSDPVYAKTATLGVVSVAGGAILVCSVLLFFYVLFRSSFAARAESMPPIRYALSVNPPATVPRLLNGFGLWTAILLVLMVLTYGYPIGQFFFLHNQDACSTNPIRKTSMLDPKWNQQLRWRYFPCWINGNALGC